MPFYLQIFRASLKADGWPENWYNESLCDSLASAVPKLELPDAQIDKETQGHTSRPTEAHMCIYTHG